MVERNPHVFTHVYYYRVSTVKRLAWTKTRGGNNLIEFAKMIAVNYNYDRLDNSELIDVVIGFQQRRK